jgi:hypothetical protein
VTTPLWPYAFLEPLTSNLWPKITRGAYIACLACRLSLKTSTSAVQVVSQSICFDHPLCPLVPIKTLIMERKSEISTTLKIVSLNLSDRGIKIKKIHLKRPISAQRRPLNKKILHGWNGSKVRKRFATEPFDRSVRRAFFASTPIQ